MKVSKWQSSFIYLTVSRVVLTLNNDYSGLIQLVPDYYKTRGTHSREPHSAQGLFLDDIILTHFGLGES